MKRKSWVTLIAVVLIVSCMLLLVGCGKKCEHQWGDWTVVTAETCTQDGLREHTCELCGEKQSEKIPAAHLWEKEWTIDKEPTVKAEGEKSHHCSRCDERTDITAVEKIGETVGLIYELNSDGESYTLTGYDGRAQRAKILVVPELHEGKPVTAIGDEGLENMFAEEIYLPDTIESIGDFGLQGCDSITELKLPASLRTLGRQALAECDNLSSVILPEGLATIGAEQFWRVPIASLHIPSTVDSIGESMVIGCKNLTEITVAEGNANYYAESGCLVEKATQKVIAGYGGDVIIPDGVQEIGASAFKNTAITSVVFPNTITKIGRYAFNGCVELAEAEINGTISASADWEGDTFADCTKLSKVTMGEGIKRIGASAFKNTAIEEIVFPDSLMQCNDDEPFAGTPLKKISIGEKYQDPSNISSGHLEEIDVTRNSYFTLINGMLFKKNTLAMFTAQERLDIPEKYTTKDGVEYEVSTIEGGAFMTTPLVKEIVLPKTLKDIGQYALQGFVNLEKLTLQSVVKVISEGILPVDWLLGCNNLKELHLPAGIKFDVLPANKNILFGGDTDYADLALTDIYYGGTTAEWQEITKDANVPSCEVHCVD